jgi:transposase
MTICVQVSNDQACGFSKTKGRADMPRKGLTMRQIRELLRLKTCEPNLSKRDLGLRLGVAPSTVRDCLNRLAMAGLIWPLPDELTDDVLEQRLFRPAGVKGGSRKLPEPDWPSLMREMKRAGVTLQILWEEYQQVHPDGYQYSRFCDLYRAFEKRVSPTMRQHHVAGDKVFVDYSGKKIDIVNPETGEVLEADIFVAVLGASNYTYAEATRTQSLPDWIGSHVRLFDFIGGCPRLLVPDNLKSGVNKASFYDPEINRTYGRMAEHYGIGVMPTRPYKPRDKAKVEAGVRVAQFYILGRLRNRTFFSLSECNQAICEALTDMNGRVMRRLGVSRSDLYREIEKPALRPLPAIVYEYAEWKRARVNLDYHVELLGHYYSVPYGLIRQEVDARMTADGVELFHRGKRVAAHVRLYATGGAGHHHVTLAEHMPKGHLRYAGWSEGWFRSSAAAIGPNTEGLMVAVMANRKYPEQGFRSCQGILDRLRGIDPVRAESACARALEIGALSSKSLGSILDNNLDRKARRTNDATLPLFHNNIRGGGYYH